MTTPSRCTGRSGVARARAIAVHCVGRPLRPPATLRAVLEGFPVALGSAASLKKALSCRTGRRRRGSEEKLDQSARARAARGVSARSASPRALRPRRCRDVGDPEDVGEAGAGGRSRPRRRPRSRARAMSVPLPASIERDVACGARGCTGRARSRPTRRSTTRREVVEVELRGEEERGGPGSSSEGSATAPSPLSCH